jgi:hypothetical protein
MWGGGIGLHILAGQFSLVMLCVDLYLICTLHRNLGTVRGLEDKHLSRGG